MKIFIIKSINVKIFLYHKKTKNSLLLKRIKAIKNYIRKIDYKNSNRLL